MMIKPKVTDCLILTITPVTRKKGKEKWKTLWRSIIINAQNIQVFSLIYSISNGICCIQRKAIAVHTTHFNDVNSVSDGHRAK